MNRFDATGRRVVVTGWGCVSRLGLTLDATWNALCDATTSQHEFFPAHRDDASRLGPLAKWKSTFVDIRFRQTAGPVGQYAIVATLEALQSAGIEPGSIPADRIGVLIGSMFGGLQEIHRIDRLLQRGKKSRAGTMGSTRCLNSSAAVNVSAAIGAQSECHSPSTMFCSGLDSIGFAAELISQGVLNCAVCGGSDEDCLDVVGPALLKLDSLDDEGLDAPGRGRPFDQQRNGIIPAAGTGILILESAEAATARGARILVELAGYGTAFAQHRLAPPPRLRQLSSPSGTHPCPWTSWHARPRDCANKIGNWLKHSNRQFKPRPPSHRSWELLATVGVRRVLSPP